MISMNVIQIMGDELKELSAPIKMEVIVVGVVQLGILEMGPVVQHIQLVMPDNISYPGQPLVMLVARPVKPERIQ